MSSRLDFIIKVTKLILGHELLLSLNFQFWEMIRFSRAAGYKY